MRKEIMLAEAPEDTIFVTKRSGELTRFDAAKIRDSIVKASLATGNVQSNEEQTDRIVTMITQEIEARFSDFIPNVENIQDIIEKNLMKHQLYDVAKAYILYRAERQKERDEQRKKKSFLRKLTVKKRNGRVVLFNYKKLEDTVRRACREYLDGIDVSPDLILEEAIKNIYDGVSSEEIDRALILSASSLIENDPGYSKVASRLFLQKIRKEVLRESIDFAHLPTHYQQAFVDGVTKGVEYGLLDKRMLDFDLAQLAEVIKPERDDLFEYIGIQTLYERYLLKYHDARLELPQAFWMRVAMGLSLNEDDKNARAAEFYEVLSSFRVMSSTPTLFHSGTACPQLSSCYLSYVGDDLNHIFKCLGDNAQLSKWSGGLGNDWTAVRATGAWIKSTNVESQGVIPFLKIANDVTCAINRSGKRRGATCAYLETWHLDIEDFLDLRKNTGDERRRTHDMNTANWIPDLFMKRVKEQKEWTLFSPEEVPELHELYGAAFEKKYVEYEKKAAKGLVKKFKVIEAAKLWKKMLTSLFETGHPWLTWKDPSNVRSPQDHCGVVHSSNLCTEILLNTSPDETAVCNLCSINLKEHFNKKNQLDTKKLAASVETAVRMLDNVIDENFYPTVEAKNSNFKHRPIGLGLMGFQDALFIQNLPFDCEEAVEFSDRMMEFISYHAILTSSKLAKARGKYSSYEGSKWSRNILPHDTLTLLEKERGLPIPVEGKETLDWVVVREHIKEHGMRNSNIMAIAPTATISTLTDCFPCIEPIYKNIYVKANISGEFTIVNHYLIQDLKKIGKWDNEMLQQIKYHDGNLRDIAGIPEKTKNKHKEAFEIEPIWLIRHAAARGKWIDQSQSLNIFIKGVSGKKLHDTYMACFDAGLKTTYYLRTLAVSQVEKSTLDAGRFGFTQMRNGETNGHVNGEAKACRIDNPDCESCQ